MKALFRLLLVAGITITFIGTWACVGQNTGDVGPDANSNGAAPEGSAEGSGLAPDAGAPNLIDTLGDGEGSLEGDPENGGGPTKTGEDPNDGNVGQIIPGNQVMVVQGISKSSVIGSLQATKTVTQNSYCTEKFEDCDADADNVSEKAACGSNYNKCMDPYNCGVQKQVCMANNNPMSQCLYDYDMCFFLKECRQIKKDCMAKGGDNTICQSSYDNCKADMESKYDHCQQLRNECMSNYGGNAQQCQTVYNDCISNI